MTTTLRTDTWLNTISIDGGAPITMDTFKGGDNDSSTTIYRPGGMVKPKVIGGQTTISDITLDKSMEMETDWTLITALMKANVGKSEVVVMRQPLDPDANPYGSPLIYNGILKQVLPGDTDSMKADALLWSVVVTPDGVPG